MAKMKLFIPTASGRAFVCNVIGTEALDGLVGDGIAVRKGNGKGEFLLLAPMEDEVRPLPGRAGGGTRYTYTQNHGGGKYHVMKRMVGSQATPWDDSLTFKELRDDRVLSATSVAENRLRRTGRVVEIRESFPIDRIRSLVEAAGGSIAA